jgi:hypothetical protein
VPRPRLHLIRFHGVLAPNAKLRAMVVPQSPGSARPRHYCRPPGGADAAASVGRADAPAPQPFLRWSDLLRRVYDIDMRTCPNCGQGRLEPIATILAPDVIARMLPQWTASRGRPRPDAVRIVSAHHRLAHPRRASPAACGAYAWAASPPIDTDWVRRRRDRRACQPEHAGDHTPGPKFGRFCARRRRTRLRIDI